MLKNMIKTVVFLMILIALFLGIFHVLSWKDTDGSDATVFQELYDTPDNLIDVLFLGSSHCYCTVNNSILWQDYGLSTFNMSVSGQDMASTYYCFKEVLKTQKPKVVMVEMCYASWYGYAVEGNLFRNVLNYRYSKNFEEVVKAIVPEERQLDMLLKLPIIHTRYKELRKSDLTTQEKYNRGYWPSYHTEEGYNPMYTYEGEKKQLKEDTKEWIDKIVSLANENNIQVVFFLAPYSASDEDKAYFRSLTDYATEKNIPMINFLELWTTLNLDPTLDFSDRSHVNVSGAEKVTRYLGDFLLNNYTLLDHRGYGEYYLWDLNTRDYNNTQMNQTLKNTTDFFEYLKLITLLKDYTVVISLDGTYWKSELIQEELTDKIGISEFTFFQGGTWVMSNQELEFYSEGKTNFFYHMELSQGDLAVKGYTEVNDDDKINIFSECKIDNEHTKKIINGINIVIYDNFKGEIADSVGFNTDTDLSAIR